MTHRPTDTAESRGSDRIRVILADDHEMVREALARILEESGRIRVVAQASDGSGTVRAARAERPAVVVLDYSMPGRAAAGVIEKLLQALPDIKILVLTVHENIQYAVRVLESGAHGYLIKSAAVDQLVEAIAAVHRGEIYICSRIAQEVLLHLRQPKRERVGLDSLSQREFDLLRLLGAGKTLVQCAREMKVSTSTVSTYRARIMEKLRLESTAEIIRFALEQDVVG